MLLVGPRSGKKSYSSINTRVDAGQTIPDDESFLTRAAPAASESCQTPSRCPGPSQASSIIRTKWGRIRHRVARHQIDAGTIRDPCEFQSVFVLSMGLRYILALSDFAPELEFPAFICHARPHRQSETIAQFDPSTVDGLHMLDVIRRNLILAGTALTIMNISHSMSYIFDISDHR